MRCASHRRYRWTSYSPLRLTPFSGRRFPRAGDLVAAKSSFQTERKQHIGMIAIDYMYHLYNAESLFSRLFFSGFSLPALCHPVHIDKDWCAVSRCEHPQCSTCEGGIWEGRGRQHWHGNKSDAKKAWWIEISTRIYHLMFLHPPSIDNCPRGPRGSFLYCGLLWSLWQDLIKRIILNNIGFDAVNQAVRSRLLDELTILLLDCKLGGIRGVWALTWCWYMLMLFIAFSSSCKIL